MEFNKEQRDGLSKVVDNLATACMIAAIVGGLVDHKIGWETIAVLIGLCLTLLSVSFILRIEKGDRDGD